MPHHRSTPKSFHQAHYLRHKQTQAELKLWTYLRSHRLENVHFRRQHSIGKYIVDFCAPKQKLIVEVDGSQHLERKEQDLDRSEYLAGKGYTVLRFWNNDVLNDLDTVIKTIDQALIDRDNSD